MFTFIRDMFLGWIIFTSEGKQLANTIVSKTFNHIKKNTLKSNEIKELMSIKDVFIKNNDNEVKYDKHNKHDNRTKN